MSSSVQVSGICFSTSLTVCFALATRASATGPMLPSPPRPSWSVEHMATGASRGLAARPARYGDAPSGNGRQAAERFVDGCGIGEAVSRAQVDVLRGAFAAVQDDGETADQDVAGPGFFEGAADAPDVVDGWRADLWDISLLSHAWASSKVANRKRPRGASPRVPRRALTVRSKVSALCAVAAPSRRLPTTLEGSKSISRSCLTKDELIPRDKGGPASSAASVRAEALQDLDLAGVVEVVGGDAADHEADGLGAAGGALPEGR